MKINRIVKHLLVTDGHVGRTFTRSSLNKIEQAIKTSEAAHVGEIRFAVEGARRCSKGRRPETARSTCSRNCACGTPSTTPVC